MSAYELRKKIAEAVVSAPQSFYYKDNPASAAVMSIANAVLLVVIEELGRRPMATTQKG